MLCALAERGELCVCQLQALVALAPSSTSKHLSLLASAGLVSVRKDGRWAYYRVAAPEEMPEDAAGVVDWIAARAGGQRAAAEDRARMDAILRFTPEELCRRMAEGAPCCPPAGAARAKTPRTKADSR